MKVVVIDNYDSFTFNLTHLVKELGVEVDVLRNNAFQLEDLEKYDKLIFSPGPGIPKEAGLMEDVIRYYAGRKSMLGVCLGEQAIGEVFGARLLNLSQVFHGMQTSISVQHEDPLFEGLPKELQVGRYHSWVVSPQNFPACLQVIARSGDGNIMAISHKLYPVVGIQFHPESVLTPQGKEILANWLEKINTLTPVK